jgi:hypothetical protein
MFIAAFKSLSRFALQLSHLKTLSLNFNSGLTKPQEEQVLELGNQRLTSLISRPIYLLSSSVFLVYFAMIFNQIDYKQHYQSRKKG